MRSNRKSEIHQGKSKGISKECVSLYYRLDSKAFHFVNHELMWILLREMGMSEHLICVIRNLFTKQEDTVRREYEEIGWFGIGKEVRQAVYSLPSLV